MIQLSTSSGVPIFKQIVDQIVYMIEAGQLADGDRLPSSRMLAANLHVNRNTVARAYAQLRDRGYIESQRRNGMIVTGAESVRREAIRHEEAQRVLGDAVTQCLELGLSADEIATIAYHESVQAQHDALRLVFVECNAERAEDFSSKLSERLAMPVEPLVLGELRPDDLGQADLVITTFFHLAEVRALARSMRAGEAVPEVLAIVVAPHVQTLVRLAQIPKRKRIGILYWTQDQAETIRQSLLDTGLGRIEVIGSASREELEGIDLLVMPSENPELREQVGDSVPVVEYGNVLDEASVRMVVDVLDDLRGRRLHTGMSDAEPAAAAAG
jgi:GntR family transcriptional regulator